MAIMSVKEKLLPFSNERRKSLKISTNPGQSSSRIGLLVERPASALAKPTERSGRLPDEAVVNRGCWRGGRIIWLGCCEE
jgi:hypothetical protein